MTQEEYIALVKQKSQEIIDLSIQFEMGGQEDSPEVKVAKLFCDTASVITYRDRYIQLVQQGVAEGWYKYIVILYLPSIVSDSTKKLLNSVDPYDTDDSFRGKVITGSLNIDTKGIKIRNQRRDEISTNLDLYNITSFPYFGFGAYIQQSANLITEALHGGFNPTLDEGGTAYFRICTEQHPIKLPAGHVKPKGLIFGNHNRQVGAAEFWHNQQLVFSDVANSTYGYGDIVIHTGSQGYHPTDYFVLSMYTIYNEIPNDLLIKMQAAFNQFITDIGVL